MADQQKAPLKKTAGLLGGKDECQVRLKGTERDYWIGTEIGMLGDYGFQRQVTAGDGSDKLEKKIKLMLISMIVPIKHK